MESRHDDWNARIEAADEEDITPILEAHGNEARTQEIEDDSVQPSKRPRRSWRGQYLKTVSTSNENTEDLIDIGPPEVMVTNKSNRKPSDIRQLHGVEGQPRVPSNPLSLFTAGPISVTEDIKHQKYNVLKITIFLKKKHYFFPLFSRCSLTFCS